MERPGTNLMKAILHAHETTMRNLMQQGGGSKQPGRIQAGPYSDGYRTPKESQNLKSRQFGPGPNSRIN